MSEITKEVRKESCPRCSAEIGAIVIIAQDYRPHFYDGAMLVLVGRRPCPSCGWVYHWDGNKVRLKQSAENNP